ncbi:hypothetical protein Cni_G15582 [Canna indica]|uniref:Uncharacterized protein n=1 Tax=Canna indica TaxID=4628 RepID=A0AAQ3KH97_9LILI|nr:hypothetical protein Cni_G15582 [Canna indica]
MRIIKTCSVSRQHLNYQESAGKVASQGQEIESSQSLGYVKQSRPGNLELDVFAGFPIVFFHLFTGKVAVGWSASSYVLYDPLSLPTCLKIPLNCLFLCNII